MELCLVAFVRSCFFQEISFSRSSWGENVIVPWELRFENWTTTRQVLPLEMAGRDKSGGARNGTDVDAWPKYLSKFRVASH